MYKNFIDLLNLFFRSRLGAVAVAFGLSLPVLLCAAGVATDTSRGWLVKQRLTSALDAAALAGASSASDEEAIQEKVDEFIAANYPDDRLGVVMEVDAEFDEDENIVTVTAEAQVDTLFMSLFGFETLDVTTDVEIKRANRTNIELAMALDLSGSMAGSRIEDLIEAANEMVDIIVSEDQETVYSKIALVPYSMAVNVGSYANSIRGTYSSGTCTSPGCRYYRFRNTYNDWRTHQISTCVTERTGIYAYTDDPPSTAYMGRNYPSSGNGCLSSRIVPLTSDIDYLHEQIDDLEAGGSTGGQVGVAWGWYMLSENFGYLWDDEENEPAPYGTENLVKILVLMTDGEYNSPYCNGVIARDATSGSGSAADHINCNATNGSAYSQAQTMCEAMKEAGIIVYTVGFDIVDSEAAEDLMAECATDAAHVYLAEDGDELIQAFKSIAGDILTVYVSK